MAMVFVPEVRSRSTHEHFFLQETQRLIAEPVAGISATPYQDNLRYFAVAIEGPGDSPYERGVFQLELFLPADYPMVAPSYAAARSDLAKKMGLGTGKRDK